MRNKPIFLILVKKKPFLIQIPLETNDANQGSPNMTLLAAPTILSLGWEVALPPSYPPMLACNSLRLKTNVKPKQKSGAKI